MPDNLTIRDKTAIVGIGETTYYKHGQSPETEFELAVTSVTRAAEDAGLPLSVLDGFASYSGDSTNPVKLANALGFDELRYSNMFWGGGGGGVCGAVGNAAAAVAAGYADYVVVLRSLVQGNYRFGGGVGVGESTVSGSMAYVVPYGLTTPAQHIALRTKRFMFEHGLSQDVLAAIALASYEHAAAQPASRDVWPSTE